MVRFAFALLLSAFITTAQAASPVESLTAIGSGGSTYPLPDPALVVEHLWITQGVSGDFKITPTQMGYILQKTTAPLNPMLYQQWLDTSVSPTLLKRWMGTQWVTERTLGTSPPSSGDVTGLTNAHIFVGNSSGVATDVAVSGDLTLANTGAFTIVANAITTAKILDLNVTTAKIADAAVTKIKIAGIPVYGATNVSTSGHPAFFSNNTGDGISDNGALVGVTSGGTGAATFTAHGVLVGAGTASIVATAAGTIGYPLLSGGASADPLFAQLDLASGAVSGVLPQANFTMTPTFTTLASGSVSTSSNVSVGGALTVTGNASVTGSLGITTNLAVTGSSVLTGAISFGDTLSRDANFYLALAAGSPVVNFNPNVYLLYDRSLSRFSLTIGASNVIMDAAGNLTVPGCVTYNGGVLGVCL